MRTEEKITFHDWDSFKKAAEAQITKMYYGKKTAGEMDALLLNVLVSKSLEINNNALASVH